MNNIVAKFQEQIGSTPDGIWGKNTLRAAVKYYKLTNEAGANFFGQIAYESGNFTVFSENLNYPANRLLELFPKYFTVANVQEYANNPEKIANRMYADRMGNGSEESGDGWRFRGRGSIQITGKTNYLAFGKSVGLSEEDLINTPDIITQKYSFECAKWYFDHNKLWTLANSGIDNNTVKKITKAINGGYMGLTLRKSKVNEYFRILRFND